MDVVKNELKLEMNYTTIGKHVTNDERNNRTIAECIHAHDLKLYYKAIPKCMLR